MGACAHARQSAPPLPQPLAAALLDRYGPNSQAPEFFVGVVPAGFPAQLVPKGPVQVIGGMRVRDQIDAVFADSTRRLAAVFEDLFVASGFRTPPPPRPSGFSGIGGPSAVFCGDSAMVSAAPLDGAQRNFVRVTYRPMRGAGSCMRLFSEFPSHGELQVPDLKPPAGVRVGRSGGGSGGDGVDSHAEMTGTSLEPATILAHYAAQLSAAGWTAASPAISDRLAGQYFEAKDSAGATWEGFLLAAGGGKTMSLSLVMHPKH